MPTVSVIIPLYNAERYVEASLRSALGQSFDDFELIVVNDGSTDGSLRICTSVVDSRMKIIDQANQGVSAARNAGIRASCGCYVAFLDADDLWHPDTLHWHLARMETSDAIGVTYSWSAIIDAEGRRTGAYQRPDDAPVDFVRIMRHNPIGNGSCVLIRRSVLDQAALHRSDGPVEYCDVNLPALTDFELWLRIAAKTRAGFALVPHVLTEYRVHADSISGNVHANLLRVAEEVFARAHGYAPDEVDRWARWTLAHLHGAYLRRALDVRNSTLAWGLFRGMLMSCPRYAANAPVTTAKLVARLVALTALGPGGYAALEHWLYDIRERLVPTDTAKRS